MLAWRSSKDGLAGVKLGESRRNFLPWTDCDHNHQRVVGFMERFRGASARIKGSRHNVFCWNLLLSPSVSPNSLEHLLGSPLYLMSGAGAELLVTVAGGRRGSEGALTESEGGLKESKGREKGEEGVGEGAEVNCRGGGMGGGVGEGVVRAVVATGGVHTELCPAAAAAAAAWLTAAA